MRFLSILHNKSFSYSVFQKNTLLGLILILLLPHVVLPLQLDVDGAYHVVVAVDSKTAENNIKDYISNMKIGLQRLSDLLHQSTDLKLYIKSVDIVLPEHWFVAADEVSSMQYFENSDIRISHEFHEPYVYNPTLCGLSGEYMQLPYDFFNNNETGGQYGRYGKVLLTQWARYRYGIWEEHGYPLDAMFPYFYQNVDNADWKVNYCADINLTGDTKTIDDGECNRENPDVNPPGYDCRFYPHEGQTPSSSLMSFHFMDTITKFCNATTHDNTKPNRQNIYCGYRSAREVIEASSDWKSVTDEQAEHPRPIQYKVLKMANKPLLSLVLDGGLTQNPVYVVEKIKENLKALVNGSLALPGGILVHVGSFSAEGESQGMSLKEELPWSDIVQSKEDFEKAIDASFSKTSGFRNFGLAIKQAAENIKQRKSEFGSVMVIVKTGEATNFEKIYFEDEVIAAIKESGTKVHAFEVRGNNLKPSMNLGNLVRETGGTYSRITGQDDLDEMPGKVAAIAEDLKDFQFNPSKKSRPIYKGIVSPDTEIVLSVADISKLRFYLTPIDGAVATNAKIEQVEEGQPPTVKASVSLQEKIDWHIGEPTPGGLPRKTHVGEFSPPESNPEPEKWKITYDCVDWSKCKSYFFIYGEWETETNIKSDEIQVFITTSAVDGVIDLDKALQKAMIEKANTPFGIYVKLEHNGFPVRNVGHTVSVQAMISSRGTTEFTIVDLLDNGQGIPDLTLNDGIFSGSFIPYEDGMFTISIRIHFIAEREDPGDGGGSRSLNSGKIISNDQHLIGCGTDFSGCWSTVLPFDFMKVVDYRKNFRFLNKETYRAYPQKIVDFKITQVDDYQLLYEFTHPGTVEAEGFGITHEYEIYYKESFQDLVTDVESGTIIREGLPYPDLPGTKFSWLRPLQYNVTYYYAVRSFYGGSDSMYFMESPASNIVGATSIEHAPVTISPVTPPTTTTTTSTTTRITTAETTTPSTKPTTTPVTTTTTRRTTTIRTTTTGSPTTSPGPTKSTTPEPKEKIKHWYQEPEGYITLSVFGAGLLCLISVGFTYMWCKNRSLNKAKEELIKNEGPIV